MDVFYRGEYLHRIFCAAHVPPREAKAGLVFCPPFGQEMGTTYCRFAQWGKELEEQGFAVLRFHPRGSGESDGSTGSFTLESACADAVSAAECLRERARIKRVGLIGLRFGGSVAVHAAPAADADFIMLWSPIVNLRIYARELLRLRLTKELVHQQRAPSKGATQTLVQELESGRLVDIVGHQLSPEFYRQLRANPGFPEAAPAPEVLWLARPSEEEEALPVVKAWKASGARVDEATLPEHAFWEQTAYFPEQFATASCRWLAQRASETIPSR